MIEDVAYRQAQPSPSSRHGKLHGRSRITTEMKEIVVHSEVLRRQTQDITHGCMDCFFALALRSSNTYHLSSKSMKLSIGQLVDVAAQGSAVSFARNSGRDLAERKKELWNHKGW
jgi:hypothetical protein